MKITAISDLVLDPLFKDISNRLSEVENEIFFYEDIISALRNFQPSEQLPDFFWIHTDFCFKKADPEQQKLLLRAIHAFAGTVKSTVLVSNIFGEPFPSASLSGDFGARMSHLQILKSEIDLLHNSDNIYFFNIADRLASLGSSAYSYSLGHLYQMPYTKKAIETIGSAFAELIGFLNSAEKKVIVLDCDNTLWKGIVGEDGIDGISCDLSAQGILHYHFHQFLKTRKENGFLLCLCSKNNEDEVKMAFETLPMPLKWDDFIVKKVNWTDKVQNLKDIARELNLGTDSFIFVDDSDFEIESVRQLLPGVSSFQISPDYNSFLSIISNHVFRRRFVSDEDLQKHAQYQQEAARKSLEDASGDMDDYIKALEIKLDIRTNDYQDLERVSQLTGKTNQFNMNKVPYTIKELEDRIEKGGSVYTLRVSDRFGSYGLVGVFLLDKPDENKVTIENFLMSCRALGRRIEFDFFNYIRLNLHSAGVTDFVFTYHPTPKNSPAKAFLDVIQKSTEA